MFLSENGGLIQSGCAIIAASINVTLGRTLAAQCCSHQNEPQSRGQIDQIDQQVYLVFRVEGQYSRRALCLQSITTFWTIQLVFSQQLLMRNMRHINVPVISIYFRLTLELLVSAISLVDKKCYQFMLKKNSASKRRHKRKGIT